MKELAFSTMFDIAPATEMGDGFFDAFTARHQIKIKPQHIDWPNSWNQLVQFGLNGHGPDVSEVGTTWLGSFHTMEALHPLSQAEIAIFGDEKSFPKPSWEACHLHQNNIMLAIPWTLDIRMVFYRRDWLAKAGVDEATAFRDSDQFRETLSRIRAAGHPAPLGLSTFQSHTRLIHDMASWVWSAGGNLRSDDGSRMLLMEPKSRAGMQAYFNLNEFVSPEMQTLQEDDVIENFFKGKTAVTILPERSYLEIINNKASLPTEVTENIGMAMLMQAPYIGGSALVVWRHSMDYQDALKLIHFLTSQEAWNVLNIKNAYHRPFTPARLDVLDKAPLSTTPYYPAIQQSLKHGRSFHSGYRWNGVEGRLVMVIQQLWNDLHANPTLNLAHEVEQRFSSACSRLEQTILASSW